MLAYLPVNKQYLVGRNYKPKLKSRRVSHCYIPTPNDFTHT